MKKIHLLLWALLLAAGSFAQSKTAPAVVHLPHPEAVFFTATRFAPQALLTNTDIAAFISEGDKRPDRNCGAGGSSEQAVYSG